MTRSSVRGWQCITPEERIGRGGSDDRLCRYRSWTWRNSPVNPSLSAPPPSPGAEENRPESWIKRWPEAKPYHSRPVNLRLLAKGKESAGAHRHLLTRRLLHAADGGGGAAAYCALLCLRDQRFEVKDTLAAALMQIGGGSASR